MRPYREVASKILLIGLFLPNLALSSAIDDAKDMIEASMPSLDLNEVRGIANQARSQFREAESAISESVSENAALNEANSATKKAEDNLSNFKQNFDFEYLKSDVKHIENEMKLALEKQSESTPKLLAFVSFSMPKQALLHFIRDADRFGGSVVVRGMVDSTFPKTVAKIQNLLAENDNQGGISIDPNAFKSFNIQKVPAVVLVEKGKHDVVYGLSGLKPAIKLFAESGETKESAKSLMERAG